MLETIRKHKTNFISSFIILLVILVMGMYGVGQLAHDTPGEVGSVNGEAISFKDYQNSLAMLAQRYRAIFGDKMDEQMLQSPMLKKQALESLVDRKILSQEATRLGFQVSDKELADYIQKIPYFQKNGRFDYEAYTKMPNRGLEEYRMREDLKLERFSQYVQNRIQLPPAEALREFELQETKVDLEYAKISLSNLASKIEPTKEDVKTYIADEKNQAAIKAYYDSRANEFTKPGEVEINQIRVGLPFQASAQVKEKAKEKISAIAKEVNSSNFSEVAKTKSDDEYAAKGGVRGWIARGTLEKSLEEALDKLKPGEVSAPIETSFGYYLIQVKNSKPSEKKSFEDAKETIARNLVQTQKRQDFENKKKEEWEKKLEAGGSLDAELKALKIDVKKTGSFSLAQGYIPQIGDAPAIAEAVGNLSMSNRSPKKLFYHQDNYYYIRLANVTRPTGSDFTKNRESVERSGETALQSALFKDWLDKLKKGASIETSKKI